MNRRTGKPKPSRRRRDVAERGKANRITAGEVRCSVDHEFLIVLGDELNVIDEMLGSLAKLIIMADFLRENTADRGRDSLGAWARSHIAVRTLEAETIQSSCAALLDAPDAIIEIARWRLDRVQRLLESLCRKANSNERGN